MPTDRLMPTEGRKERVIKTVTVPIYHRRIYFVDDATEARTLRERLQTSDEREATSVDLEERSHGTVAVCSQKYVVMYVNGDLKKRWATPGYLNIVTHEATHAAGAVLTIAGVDYSYENEEAVAYLVGWVVERWHKKMEDK